MKRILITGCQCNGTTLMGLIFDSHPSISNCNEDRFVDVSQLATNSIISLELPEQSANFSFIKNEVKADSIVWMVRNPFDTIKSMMSLKHNLSRTKSDCWGATFAHVEINRILQYLPPNYFETHSKLLDCYRQTLSSTERRLSDEGIILACITCWVLKQECYQYLKDTGLNIFLVRYEDLAGSPNIVLSELFINLGIEWQDDIVNTQSIDQSGLFNSKKFFNDSELRLISNLTDSVRKKSGYPAFDSNAEFDRALLHTADNNIAYTFDWLLFRLSAVVNQKRSGKVGLVHVLKQILGKNAELPGFVFIELCKYLKDSWVIHILTKAENIPFVFSLCESLEKRKKEVADSFFRELAILNPLWGIYSCWRFNDNYSGELSCFYDAEDIHHTKMAIAIAVLIARQGDILERSKQWACLLKLSERFPKLNVIRSVATDLSNTMPNREDINSVLMLWNADDHSATSFRKVLFNFIPKHAIDISSYDVDEFEITNIETLYMAWRLNRTEQIEILAGEDTKFSRVAKSFLNATVFDDFKGRDYLYFGKERPKKLIVVFTGLASMLMYPPALVHALIDLPADVGVLWLQDVNSRAYMAGPDGKSTPYKYEEYVVQLVREIGPVQVSVVGSSAGGTISLHFSSIFPVYRSASLSPYTFLEVGGTKDRLQKSFASIFSGRIDILPELGPKTVPTRIYYGADCQRDIDNAERLSAFKHMQLIPIEDGKTHHTGEQLALQGLYSEVFDWLIEGEGEDSFWQKQEIDDHISSDL